MLVEHEVDPQLDLSIFNQVRLTCRPIRNFDEFASYRPDIELAREFGASAIFCGEFGDTIFGRCGEEYAASEYIQRHGFNPGVFAIAQEVAEYWRVSIWKVLIGAIKGAGDSRRRGDWAQYLFGFQKNPTATMQGTLIEPDAFADALMDIGRFINPWFRSVSGVSLAKLWSICALSPDACSDSPLRGPADPGLVMPLGGQLLAELALRTPAYLTLRNGKDRSIARDAFADELPEELVRRVAKGGRDEWAKKRIGHNIPFLRAFLLDGALVRERILNRKQLDLALVAGPAKTGLLHIRLIRHLYAEGWLAGWQSRRSRLAA
jgi:asparagine synthase (glutamine-hydrolysing)